MEASKISQSSVSSVNGVERQRRSKITSGHFAGIDQMFPFFDRMTQIKSVIMPIHALFILEYFAQLICVSCWPLSFMKLKDSFLGDFAWIILSNLKPNDKTTWLGVFLFYAASILITIVFSLIQIYWYSKTRKFIDWILQLIRFFFENLILILLIPSGGLIGLLYIECIQGSQTNIHIVYLAFMILFLIYLIVIFVLTYNFLHSSPYLAKSPFGCFDGMIYIVPTLAYILFSFLSCFIRSFPSWSVVIPILANLVLNIFIVYKSFTYPFLHIPMNVAFQSVFVGCIGGNVGAIIRTFYVDLPEYVPLVIACVGVIAGIIVFSLYGRNQLIKTKKYLNTPIREDESENTNAGNGGGNNGGIGNRVTDDEKLSIFQDLNILNNNNSYKYLRLSLMMGCQFLLDESMIKYIMINTNSTPVMVEYLRIAACFPSMSRLMTALISKVIVRRDISLRSRFVLYQMERITAIRNTSSSSEMTTELNDIINFSSIINKEIQSFWLSVPKDTSVFKRISDQTNSSNSRWTELLLKYPNSGRLHEEYSSFLIEVKTDFELAVYENHKSSLIELGQCLHLEKAFKLLMQNYPFYLKKGILDIRGSITSFESRKGSQISLSSTTAMSSSSQKNFSGSSSSIQMDNELQMTIARSLFSHSRLRLALQGALKGRKSPSLKMMFFWSIIAMLVSFAAYLAQYFILISFYNDRQANVERMSFVSEARTAYCYVTNYVAAQWAKATDSVFNKEILIQYNIQCSKNPTTIYDSDIGIQIYSSCKWMRDNMTRLCLAMGDIALHGLDIDIIAPAFLSDTVPYGIVSDNMMVNSIMVNFKTLFSFMVYSSGYFVNTLDNSSHWIQDDIFQTFFRNTFNFLNAIDTVYNGLASESSMSIKKIKNGNMLILIIPSVAVFIFSIPFFFIFYVGYILEAKKWLRLMSKIEDKFRQEASRSLDPKSGINGNSSNNGNRNGGPVTSGTANTSSEGSSSDTSSAHVISCIFVISMYLIVVIISVLFGIISMKTDTEFLNLNLWMLIGAIRSSYSMESLMLLGVAACINDTTKFQYPSKQDLLDASLRAVKKMSENHIIMMNGNDKVPSCYGYSADLDLIHTRQKCKIENTNLTYHDLVLCNSLTQNLALSYNYVSILYEKMQAHYGVRDTELYQFTHLVNKHMFYDLNNASILIKNISVKILDSFRTKLLILTIFGFITSLLTFFTVFFINNSLKEEYKVILQLIRRLPPNALSSSTEFLKALLNSSTQQKKDISSTSFTIIDKSPDAIVCCNRNDSIELVNPTVSKLFGYTPDQLLGQSLTQLVTSSESCNEELLRQMELMKTGESSALVYECHIKCTNDNNELIPCQCTLLGMTESSRSRDVSSFVLILSDETNFLRQQDEANEAKAKSENLLYQILPRAIVVRLNCGEKNISFVVPQASIIFIDIVAFSEYTTPLTPQEIMGNLSTIFGAFDNACARYNYLLKIKLIGDVYMAASGLFAPDDPIQGFAEQIVRFGLDCIQLLDEINVKLSSNLQVRVGANSGGPLIAGVLGTDKPVFDIIGDPINIAARLQSTDFPGHVQIPSSTFELIQGMDFAVEQRGEVFLKGKGKTMAYLVKPKMITLANSTFEFNSQTNTNLSAESQNANSSS